MARQRFTARKRVRRGASPAEYVRAYQTYQRCHGHSLGEFLAHFQRLWSDAAFHGSVTGYDGIVHLLSLLPEEWRGWATMEAEEYVVPAYPAYDLVGDFPRFLSAVFTRFVCHGSPPPPRTDLPVSEVQDPASLSEMEHRAQGATRKGKAPVPDSEDDEEEDPPEVAPVRSSCLQTVAVPSNYSRSHSTVEAAPPAPTEVSKEDPHLMWDWACGENEDDPILVGSDEEQGPKEERPQDSDCEEAWDCGYYTASGKWVWY